MPVYGRPERRPSEERSRRRDPLVVSHDARVHSPLPWSESSSPFSHFPPVLLDTTSTFTRLTHISVFYRRLINVRDHALPITRSLQLDNLTRSRQPPSAFGPEN